MAMNEKDKQWLFLGLIIPIIIVGVFFWIDSQVFKPQREALVEKRVAMENDIRDLQKELVDMNTALEQREMIMKLRKVIVERAKRFPVSLDFEGNLQQINRMVGETGINASGVSPRSQRSG